MPIEYQPSDGSPAGEESDTATAADLEMSLVDLVQLNEASVRLRNCIQNGAALGRLPYRTVGEYLAAGSDALPALWRALPSFGRKSAAELEALVWRGRSSPPAMATVNDEEVHRKARQEVLTRLPHESLEEVIQGELLGVRLGNALRDPDFASRSFRDIIENIVAFRVELMRRENIGRGSVKDFDDLVVRLVNRRLLDLGCDEAEAARLTATLLSPKSGNGEAAIVDDRPPDLQNLVEAIHWLMEGASDRDILVLRRRFGIGQEPETLEEIGRSLRRTRERVRQIEARLLRRMRQRARRIDLEKLLTEEAPRCWATWSSDGIYLREASLLRDDVPRHPYLDVALALVGRKRTDWLSSHFERRPFGWMSREVEPERLARAERLLTAAIGLPLPRPVPPDDPELVLALAEVDLNRPPYLGYLVPDRVGARVRRMVGLHLMLCDAGTPMGIVELTAHYRTQFPEDPCSVRDVMVVFENAPHLFIETVEDRWRAIGNASPSCLRRNLPKAPDAPALWEPDLEVDPDTIAGSLQSELAARGPERLTALYQEAGAFLPTGRSRNSIGPVLIMQPDLFIRLLPGVYGLPRQVPDEESVVAHPPRYLLEDWQVRLLALARRAGEPASTFPLWNCAGEYALVRWARYEGQRPAYCSLLAVADIDRWPVSEPERERWRAIAQEERRWQLEEPLREELAYTLPSPARLLAACLHAITERRLSWMTTNRLTGRRLDSQRGVELLVAMLALDALEPPADGSWLGEHRPGPAIQEAVDLLTAELQTEGRLRWGSGAGATLLDRMRSRFGAAAGWLNWDAVEAMLENRQPEIDDANLDDLLTADDADPLETAMRQHRRQTETKRREELLQWLLED